MANIEKSAYRSRLAQRAQHRSGPQGFHKNPGDFSEMAKVGAKLSTAQSILRKHWDFLPKSKLRMAEKASTKMIETAQAEEIELEQYTFALS